MKAKITIDHKIFSKIITAALKTRMGEKLYTLGYNAQLERMGIEDMPVRIEAEDVAQMIDATLQGFDTDTITVKMDIDKDIRSGNMEIASTHQEVTTPILAISMELGEKDEDSLEKAWMEWGKAATRNAIHDVFAKEIRP